MEIIAELIQSLGVAGLLYGLWRAVIAVDGGRPADTPSRQRAGHRSSKRAQHGTGALPPPSAASATAHDLI